MCKRFQEVSEGKVQHRGSQKPAITSLPEALAITQHRQSRVDLIRAAPETMEWQRANEQVDTVDSRTAWVFVLILIVMSLSSFWFLFTSLHKNINI